MNLTPVESSQLEAIGYDPETKKLHIKFKAGGATYEYDGMTPEEFEKFNSAPSKGSYFYKNIKPNSQKYPYKKL